MLYPGDPGFKYLDAEEKKLIEEIEADADVLQPLPAPKKEALLASLRNADVKKNVTMRLPESLITALKKKAGEEGIPYQTLAAMILQKYVRGALLEKDAVKEVVKALR